MMLVVLGPMIRVTRPTGTLARALVKDSSCEAASKAAPGTWTSPSDRAWALVEGESRLLDAPLERPLSTFEHLPLHQSGKIVTV